MPINKEMDEKIREIFIYLELETNKNMRLGDFNFVSRSLKANFLVKDLSLRESPLFGGNILMLVYLTLELIEFINNSFQAAVWQELEGK